MLGGARVHLGITEGLRAPHTWAGEVHDGRQDYGCVSVHIKPLAMEESSSLHCCEDHHRRIRLQRVTNTDEWLAELAGAYRGLAASQSCLPAVHWPGIANELASVL